MFEIIECACEKYNINRRRIFLAGRGAGGVAAVRVALRNPAAFAGVVSIDSSLPTLEDLPLRKWRATRNLPMLMTTGLPTSPTILHISADCLFHRHVA
ncbi:MAG: hypothetical protein HUK22_05665 [Thermoguttaceae bacterium]|nr:hypothetical protein [Thermoguttaceae bacterium]